MAIEDSVSKSRGPTLGQWASRASHPSEWQSFFFFFFLILISCPFMLDVILFRIVPCFSFSLKGAHHLTVASAACLSDHLLY